MSEAISRWQQLSLEFPGELIDAASELLETLGALSITTSQVTGEDHFDLAEPKFRNWQSTRLSALFDGDFDIAGAIKELQIVFPKFVKTLQIEKFEDQDWERVWLERFQPFKAGDNLWICPSWCEPPDQSAKSLILDPGLAFGTGSHATTGMCLQALSEMDLTDLSVTDYGCGSGILAIAAALFGASQVVANDIDPLALQATQSNASINGVSNVIKTCIPADTKDNLQTHRGICDIVIANILADALVALADDIANLVKPGGKLLLSGILDNQAENVRRAYPQFDFEQTLREDWCLLTGIKKP